MLTPGNVLYGNFSLNPQSDYKYCIVLHQDNNNPDECIITTFTTSQKRGVANPKHGRNELHTSSGGKHLTHVFKAGVAVGKNSTGDDFSFPKDSTVVPDYGMMGWKLNELQRVQGIELKCRLFAKEFSELLYTLLKSDEVVEKYKPTIESALTKLYNPPSQ